MLVFSYKRKQNKQERYYDQTYPTMARETVRPGDSIPCRLNSPDIP